MAKSKADQTEEVMQLVRDRWDWGNSELERRRECYKLDYMQILGQDIGEAKPWGAKVNSQHTHAQVLTLTSFLQSGLLPTYPWFYCEANEPWRPMEQRGTEEFNRQLRNLGYYRFQRMWLREAASLGLGVAKLYWTGTNPAFTLVHPGNLIWQHGATNLRNDADWVIEMSDRMTYSRLRAEAESGEFGWDLKEVRSIEEVRDDGTEVDRQKDLRRPANRRSDRPDRRLVLHEMTSRETIVTVHLDTHTVLRVVPNELGYINYYDLQVFPENFEIDGYSIPELGRDIQDEINTTLRQKIDISSLCANPMMTMTRSAGIDPYGQTARPGKIWLVNNHDDIKPFNLTDTSQNLLAHLSFLMQDFDRLTGVMPMTRGEQGKSMKATVASIIHSNVNIRFAVTMQQIMDYPLRQIMDDYLKLAALMEAPSAITEDEWAILRHVITRGDLWMVPHAEAYVGNSVEKFQLLNQYAQIWAPLMAPQGMAELAKEQLTLLQVRDPEKITKWIQGNPEPDPVSGGGGAPTPGAMQGGADTGRGVALREEQARGRVPGQAPMALGISA